MILLTLDAIVEGLTWFSIEVDGWGRKKSD